MGLSTDQIRKQSEAAYGQWKDQWRAHAIEHAKYNMKSLSDFHNVGIGKAVLLVANGASFESEIEVIKARKDNVDIACCDKTLGHLLEHGIKPTYAIVCDANVNYEKYMEKWKDRLQDTILIINVCGNTKWTRNGNWKEMYFFANTDILGSEKEFMDLSGCPNQVPAGTNVSNCMVVMMTQSDNSGRRNFFGYDKLILCGFDYCWLADGNYYAFDPEGSGKHNYMRHITLLTIGRDLAYTSSNLAFSAQWLNQYITTFKLPVVQTSKTSILATKKMGVLSEQMEYSFKKEDSLLVRKLVSARAQLAQKLSELDRKVSEIARDHYVSYIAS